MKLVRYIPLLLMFLFATSAFAAKYTYTPSQYSSLKSKLNSGLTAGDTVIMGNGTYSEFIVDFKGTGNESNPIVLMAQTPGQVIINGEKNMQLKMSGSYLEVNGLVFKDGWAYNGDIIQLRTGSSTFANNCRLTNCVIDNCNDTSLDKSDTEAKERWIMLYGKNNRVDHCYFANKDRAGVLMATDLGSDNSIENYHIIENNFFGYREKLPAGNGGEIIRLGDSGTSQKSSKTIVRNNFFYQCNGEVEIISLKSCDNLIQYNTFYESQGSIVCRHGRRNTIESNVFIGNNISNCGGVRIINEGHKVYNNHFQDLKGTGSRSALSIMMAFFENGEGTASSYHRVKDVDIVFNTFINCTSIELGTKPSGSDPLLAPQNTSIANNIFYSMPNAPIAVSGSDISGITLSNNIANSSTSWNYGGIVKKDIGMTQSNGLYKLNAGTSTYCIPALNSVGNFSYVTTDATNSARENGNDVGAVNYENIAKNYGAAQASECGVTWYSYSQP